MGRGPTSKPPKATGADLALFETQFYGRMVRDVAREIEWQREHPSEIAGNLLCALALVVYTEVLGRLAIEQLDRRYAKNNPHAFNAFLDRMGGGAYRIWREQWERKHAPLTVHNVLRNGLVHRYVPMNASTKFWFYFEETEDFGLGEEPGFDLVMKIRPYYDDFVRAGDALFLDLRQAQWSLD